MSASWKVQSRVQASVNDRRFELFSGYSMHDQVRQMEHGLYICDLSFEWQTKNRISGNWISVIHDLYYSGFDVFFVNDKRSERYRPKFYSHDLGIV